MTLSRPSQEDLDPGQQTLDHVPFAEADTAAQERILAKIRKAYQAMPPGPDHEPARDYAGAALDIPDAPAEGRIQTAVPPPVDTTWLRVSLLLFFCGLFVLIIALCCWLFP